MAHTLSAKRRIRTNLKAAQRNRYYKSTMKTAIKKVLTASDKTTAQEKLREAISLLDKLACKGIIHKNKAANQKSRLTKRVNAL
ncbi:MAG: 30S ribosomal protein S20 [candidate division KSB1 bacterium]|nr:30S ribosomal protein S20 [candidate division KSB1 bacterium]